MPIMITISVGVCAIGLLFLFVGYKFDMEPYEIAGWVVVVVGVVLGFGLLCGALSVSHYEYPRSKFITRTAGFVIVEIEDRVVDSEKIKIYNAPDTSFVVEVRKELNAYGGAIEIHYDIVLKSEAKGTIPISK